MCYNVLDLPWAFVCLFVISGFSQAVCVALSGSKHLLYRSTSHWQWPHRWPNTGGCHCRRRWQSLTFCACGPCSRSKKHWTGGDNRRGQPGGSEGAGRNLKIAYRREEFMVVWLEPLSHVNSGQCQENRGWEECLEWAHAELLEVCREEFKQQPYRVGRLATYQLFLTFYIVKLSASLKAQLSRNCQAASLNIFPCVPPTICMCAAECG